MYIFLVKFVMFIRGIKRNLTPETKKVFLFGYDRSSLVYFAVRKEAKNVGYIKIINSFEIMDNV